MTTNEIISVIERIKQIDEKSEVEIKPKDYLTNYDNYCFYYSLDHDVSLTDITQALIEANIYCKPVDEQQRDLELFLVIRNEGRYP